MRRRVTDNEKCGVKGVVPDPPTMKTFLVMGENGMSLMGNIRTVLAGEPVCRGKVNYARKEAKGVTPCPRRAGAFTVMAENEKAQWTSSRVDCMEESVQQLKLMNARCGT